MLMAALASANDDSRSAQLLIGEVCNATVDLVLVFLGIIGCGHYCRVSINACATEHVMSCCNRRISLLGS